MDYLNMDVMKYGCIFLFSLFFLNCRAQGTFELVNGIRIEHIGSSDKPIFTVVICEKKFKPIVYERVVVLDPAVFKMTSDFVSENNTGKIRPDSYEFGVFKIIIKKSGMPDAFYILPTRKFSIDYFKELNDRVPLRYSDFHNAIDELLIRIRF